MDEKIIVYAHPFCPMVGPVEGLLKRIGADYDYINIHAIPEARLRVQEINRGMESVPTLVFPDGTTLTEPSGAQLADKLEQMGYEIPEPAFVVWMRNFFNRFRRS